MPQATLRTSRRMPRRRSRGRRRTAALAALAALGGFDAVDNAMGGRASADVTKVSCITSSNANLDSTNPLFSVPITTCSLEAGPGFTPAVAPESAGGRTIDLRPREDERERRERDEERRGDDAHAQRPPRARDREPTPGGLLHVSDQRSVTSCPASLSASESTSRSTGSSSTKSTRDISLERSAPHKNRGITSAGKFRA